MKLYWANWAFRIFLLRRQPESRSESAMKPASVNCLHTWQIEIPGTHLTHKRSTAPKMTVCINMTVLKRGQHREVEDIPSWHNPHRTDWQAPPLPGVEKATEALSRDRHAKKKKSLHTLTCLYKKKTFTTQNEITEWVTFSTYRHDDTG